MISPPSAADKPSAPGFGGGGNNTSGGATATNNSAGANTMSGMDINALSASIINDSTQMKEVMYNDKNIAETTGDWANATDDMNNGNKLIDNVNKNIDSLIELSQKGIANAPSAEAKQAMEEMVSKTVAIGIGNIADSIDRLYDELSSTGSGLEATIAKHNGFKCG